MKRPEVLVAAEMQVRGLVEEWEPLLRVPANVQHVFIDSSYSDDAQRVADTDGSWEYRDFVVRWYLPKVALMRRKDVEGSVVHEYVHVLMNSIERLLPEGASTEQCEYATENVAQALLGARAATP